ncbi:hypothetical protein D9M72_646080 [compost metagenome]
MLALADIGQIHIRGLQPGLPVPFIAGRVQQQVLLQIGRCLQGYGAFEHRSGTHRRELFIEEFLRHQ